MALSIRARLLVGFLLANAALAAVAMLAVLSRPDTPPSIQGVLLPDARELQRFSLLDHHNRAFTNEDLKGHWHLLAYGYTTCPDICPTTLSQLAEVDRELKKQGQTDLRFLFYTVDHQRDTVSQMAAYVPFFNPDFVGLTHLDDSRNLHLPFEQSLGIGAQLVPNMEPGAGALSKTESSSEVSHQSTAEPAANDYQVYHSVTLLLINPEGQLQAILKPDNSRSGSQSFDPATIVRDYLAIRHYLARA